MLASATGWPRISRTDPQTVAAKQQLRRGLVGLPPEKAIDSLLGLLRRAKTNTELLAAVS